MWTVARDALSDLQKLGYAIVGVLPRKRSEVDRLRGTPCKLTDSGLALARLYAEKRGQAFDELLVAWMKDHPYFRLFTERLFLGPLYVPDVTTMKQVGTPAQSSPLVDRIVASGSTRLAAIGYPSTKQAIFAAVVKDRASIVEVQSSFSKLDAKTFIDVIQDKVVIPAFLAAENLPFDAVTFQHLLKVSQEFLSASWTSSYPTFEGRVIFATCEFRPAVVDERGRIEAVVHHGKSYATAHFKQELLTAYQKLGGSQGGYVSAYALRALVCLEMGIQPTVFAHCLEEIIRGGRASGMAVFTELPFSPPPSGEVYVEIGNRRIGLIKIAPADGG